MLSFIAVKTVSALRVINDDVIAGHQGFGQHPHDNMEILTCVLKGTITHKDSMGNHGGISAGEWQLMSAGTGVQHSEMNQGDEPVHLLQIWITPNQRDAAPTYQQIRLDPHEQQCCNAYSSRCRSQNGCD